MKKIAYIILIVGVLILGIGIYNFIFVKQSNVPENNINYTGKYTKSLENLYIYQEDVNNIYFIVNDNIFGTASINNGKLIGTANNETYNFELLDNNLKVVSNDRVADGLYKKDSAITIEEFYNIKFGNIELLNSIYNGKYKNEKMEISIYQSKDNEITGYLKNNKEMLLLNFIIKDGRLMSTHDDDNYVILLRDKNILYTKEGSLEFIQEELPLERKLTYKDVLDLYIK